MAKKTELLPTSEVLKLSADGISKESAKMAAGCPGSLEAVSLLQENNLAIDAVVVLACALPPKESMYWAWCCVSHYLEKDFDETGKTALAAVGKWLTSDDPITDGIDAWGLAEKEEEPSAAGWLCRGIYWCGDNVVPPDVEVQQKIPPPAGLSSKMSGLAIRLCAYLCSPDDPGIVSSQCIELGLKIAAGEGTEGL